MLKKIAIIITVCLFQFALSGSVSAAETYYTVKSGDNLWDIAIKYDTSVEKIKQLNQLTAESLQIGDVLCVKVTVDQKPATAAITEAGSTCYIVQPGDSLWGIAQRFGTSVEQIKQLNQLTSDNLQIGVKLCVAKNLSQPVAAAPQTEPAAVTPGAAASANQTENFYIIQPGDSLNSIAEACGTSVTMLKRINNLASDVINPGCVLKLSLASGDVSRGGSAVDNSIAVNILATARQYLGTPYRYGGSGPGGFDCSGFVQYVYSVHGYGLYRTAASQYSQGAPVSKADLQLGDLVFFCCSSSSIDHVGIYAGNNEFIHSSSPRSGGVIMTSLNDSYYLNSYAGAARIIR
ncbi:MAG: LysM peptidoglycan-binding domain-containing protein [Syntrophomonadaceae bacterium]|nr:LysM peptidoglycan-binding domain-containing protein [Syntrophomonadaceae bacterium]